MTVSDLIRKLQQYPGEIDVLVGDGNGNAETIDTILLQLVSELPRGYRHAPYWPSREAIVADLDVFGQEALVINAE